MLALQAAVAVFVAGVVGSASVEGQNPPNILWITCEDLSPRLHCFGDPVARTPNLDRLAADGICFTRAYANAAVCTPARSTLITGMYATSLGTEHLRAPQKIPQWLKPFPYYLRQAGYYCSNNFKEDYNFTKPPGTWDESSPQAHWRKRKPGQPFFAVFNIMTTHQSRIRFSDEQVKKLAEQYGVEIGQDPQTVPIPPYYPDTPVIRRDLARLYDLVAIMDAQVGHILRQLKEDGLWDNTIVFFFSDHGDGLPRHKRWIFDSGTRVPLIVRFPQKYQHLAPAPPGSVCSRLVSFVDFGPTVLSLAGVKIPAYMHGKAFLGPQAREDRQYVFFFRDRVDEVFETSRAVTDGRWWYIRNFTPHRPRMQYSTYSELTATRQELRRLAATGKLFGDAAWLMQPSKPPEELYDLSRDKFQLRNLAEDPAYKQKLEQLRQVLYDWMIRTHDTGLLPESEMLQRCQGDPPAIMAADATRYPVERILETADLVGRGSQCLGQLLADMGHTDPAVRFWAATGLVALKDVCNTQAAIAALQRALRDPVPCVRIAAAEGLCYCEEQSAGVAVLVDALSSPEETVRLEAAAALVRVASSVQLPEDVLRQAVQKHQGPGDFNMYIRWALQRALALQQDRRVDPLE